MLARAGACLGAGRFAPLAWKADQETSGHPGICINTATIRRQKLDLVKVVELAARTGYRGIEFWIDEIDRYEQSGGSLPDLRKRVEDSGLSLPNAIAFFRWMVDDPGERSRALEEARRRMDQLAKIGCARVAAPPAGNVLGVDLLKAAERYGELLSIGEKMGVIPALEIWGTSPALSRLGQAALVIMESGHRSACMVPDIFHLYRSGSGFDGLRLLSGDAIGIFHVNDYPARPGRTELRDSHRIFPGDGVAPLKKILRDLRSIGYRGLISLELFNRDYYRRDPAEVLREGYLKTRAVVEEALG